MPRRPGFAWSRAAFSSECRPVIGPEDETLRPESRVPDARADDPTGDPGSMDVEQTVIAGAGAPAPDARISRGTAVGRYVVISELGAGAMGRVYAAYDPKLDRRVALKVLRMDRARSDAFARAERRLLREAQALAKLSHPHVVAVHDVETHRGSLVVAMDFIAGRTLRQWYAERSRSWSEVAAVLRQAGEGLAAAHRVGLVHRDFKPDNVMIDADDRAHVVDFGLARAFDSPTRSELGDDGDVSSSDAVADEGTFATRSVGQAGTPAYMAPEQFSGEGVGPASDQFAFCVVLYEALWGRRPFDGDTLMTLTAAVLEGEVVPPPRDDVPTPIRDAVLRGLAVEPARRHPDMDALLVALRHDPGARRRRLAMAAVGLGLCSIAALGTLGRGEPEGPRPCTGGRDKLAGIWDEAAQGRARSAVLAIGRPYAVHGWEQAEPRLDAWASEWAVTHDDACAATRLRGEQSERMLDLRMTCLEGHRRELAAAVAVIEQADEDVAQRLVRIATGLPRLEHCADLDALSAAVPPPRESSVRQGVEQVRGTLARARALGLAGKYGPALAEARDAVDRAARLGYAPAHAEALLRRGYLEDKNGDAAQAEVTLSAAFWLAWRSGHDPVAARATTELAYVVGAQLERIDDGLQWARHADAAVGRTGDRVALARLLNVRSLVFLNAGRYDEAETEVRRALELRARLLPTGHVDIASTRTNLGVVLDTRGRWEEALAVYDQVQDERERMLGPEHPRVAATLSNTAQLLAIQGRPQEALPRARRALGIYEAALGSAHPELAATYNNLATVYFAMDDYDAALESMLQAVEIWEAIRDPNHPDLGDAHLNVGSVMYMLDRPVPAREHLERALEIYEVAYGPEHPEVVDALQNLGVLDRSEGALERALERHGRMVRIMRASLGAEHPRLAKGLLILGEDHVLAEHWELAQAAAQEVLAGRDVEPGLRAKARFIQARVLLSRGGDRDAALSLGRSALAEAQTDVEANELREEITQWLAPFGRPPV